MKLQEAIGHGTLISTNLKGTLGYEGVAALQLLIKAAERYSYERRIGRLTMDKLLPGETK